MTGVAGRRVLLVEDESLVAMLAEDMLLELGCEVVVAMRLEQALAQARSQSLDLAVLDVNLGENSSYPVADLLFERGIPFVFATGYGVAGLDTAYRGVPVMQKPYQQCQLGALLNHVLTCEAPRKVQAHTGVLPCPCHSPAKGNEPPRFRAD